MNDYCRRAATVAAIPLTLVGAYFCSGINWPWPLFVWVVFVPYLALIDSLTSWRSALLAGTAMAIGFFFAIFFWFALAIRDYAAAPLPVVLFVLLIAAPLLQLPFIVLAAVRHDLRRRGVGRLHLILTVAFAYVGSEWLVPKLLGDSLGLGLLPSRWMRQAIDLAGLHGLTFLVLLGNQLFLEAWYAGRRRAFSEVVVCVGAVGLIVTSLFAYGAWRSADLARRQAQGRHVRAGLVQANISHYGELATRLGTYEATKLILETHFRLSRQLLDQQAVDFLVWPETVYPTTFGAPKSEAGAELDAAIAGFVRRIGVPLVFGSYDLEAGREYNAAVFLEPSAAGPTSFDMYRKAWLFPLTEQVPWWLDWSWPRQIMPWLGTWQRPLGTSPVMTVGLRDGQRLPVAPLICYDALDPSLAIAAVRQGAELIVTMSNDSWFNGTAGGRFHLLVSSLRSIETRRPQLRVTNTGISAIIDASGEIVGTLPSGRADVLAAETVATHTGRSLMVRWGNWFPPFATAAAVLLGMLAARRGR